MEVVSAVSQPPVLAGQDFQYTLSTLGRLTEAEQFANIVIKTGSTGEATYLRDVSRIELGAKSQDQFCRLDGQPAAGLAVYLLPGANALDTADRVKAKMRDLEGYFSKGLHYATYYSGASLWLPPNGSSHTGPSMTQPRPPSWFTLAGRGGASRKKPGARRGPGCWPTSR